MGEPALGDQPNVVDPMSGCEVTLKAERAEEVQGLRTEELTAHLVFGGGVDITHGSTHFGCAGLQAAIGIGRHGVRRPRTNTY